MEASIPPADTEIHAPPLLSEGPVMALPIGDPRQIKMLATDDKEE